MLAGFGHGLRVSGKNYTGSVVVIDGPESLNCSIAVGLEVGSDFWSCRSLDGGINTAGGGDHWRVN